MKEVKDRNTKQYWKGNSMNTDIACVYFPHAYIPAKAEGQETDIINII